MEDRNGRTEINTGATLQAFNPVLSFTRHAWDKMMAYCLATKLEVSGFLVIEQDEEDLCVIDCYIAEQECTGASTEMDTTSIAKLQMELFRAGVIGKDNIMLGHFHTHCDFGVFWSSTDMLMRQVLRKGADFYVSVVCNHKGEALAAIDINGKFPMSITNVPIDVLPNTELFALCKAEVVAKVKTPQIKYEYDNLFLGGYQGNDMPPQDKRKRGRPRKTRVGEDGIIETESAREIPLDDEERQLLKEMVPIGGVYSDERGTWENIAGEIVRTGPPYGG